MGEEKKSVISGIKIDIDLLSDQLEFLYGLKEGDCAKKCYEDFEIECLDGLIKMCEKIRDFFEDD